MATKKPGVRRKKLVLTKATLKKLVDTNPEEVGQALAAAIGTRIHTCTTCWEGSLCRNCG